MYTDSRGNVHQALDLWDFCPNLGPCTRVCVGAIYIDLEITCRRQYLCTGNIVGLSNILSSFIPTIDSTTNFIIVLVNRLLAFPEFLFMVRTPPSNAKDECLLATG